MNKLESNVKMFLFGRWIATCYADEHIDDKGTYQYSGEISKDKIYNPSTALSVLNRTDGLWWAEKIKHFNDVVYPNYIKNGSAKDAENFLGEQKL